VRLYAVDLFVEKRDTCIEFVQRITIQAFAGEEAGSAEVVPGRPPPRSIIIVHCTAASDGNFSMSMHQSGFLVASDCAN